MTLKELKPVELNFKALNQLKYPSRFSGNIYTNLHKFRYITFFYALFEIYTYNLCEMYHKSEYITIIWIVKKSPVCK